MTQGTAAATATKPKPLDDPRKWKPYFLANMTHKTPALPPAKSYKSAEVYKQDMRTHSRSPYCPEDKFEKPGSGFRQSAFARTRWPT